MSYLITENISLSHGEKVLLDNVDLRVNKGDKIALVARNGSGKSTFLRIVMGEEVSEGIHQLHFHPDAHVSFLAQNPQFPLGSTVWEAVLTESIPAHKLLKMQEGVFTGNDHVSAEELYQKEASIKEILFKLNLRDLSKQVDTMSGGEKKRLGIAKLFAQEPDFMIMDEPTNHLDLDMIEWLESQLTLPNLTLLLVTHDRYFLDRICNNIIELERGHFIKYTGNYSDFLEKRAIRLETENTEKDRIRKLLNKELDWIRRQPKARTTKNKAQVDNYHERKEYVSDQVRNEELHLEIDMERLGKKILELHNISKTLGGKKLFENFDYKFRPGEKVGIVGKNGAGKTTLIKTFLGEIRPDAGKVVLGETVVFGHYTQTGMKIEAGKTVLDMVREIAEYIPLKKGRKMSAETLLERFLFPRPQQRVQVTELSGGEQRRLHLLRVLMSNPNFLILDEPTNDLDIMTLNVLESYLEEFQGCVVVISHDRYFMDKIVEHLFILEGEGKIKDYNGKYTQYRREKIQESYDQKNKSNNEKTDTASYEASKEKKNKLRKVEREIEKLEEEKQNLKTELANPEISQEQLIELSTKFGKLSDELDQKETEWMEMIE